MASRQIFDPTSPLIFKQTCTVLTITGSEERGSKTRGFEEGRYEGVELRGFCMDTCLFLLDTWLPSLTDDSSHALLFDFFRTVPI